MSPWRACTRQEARGRAWRTLRVPLGGLLQLGLGRQPDPHRSTRGSRGLAGSGDDGVELVFDELGGDHGRSALKDGLQAALGFGDPARLDVRGGLVQAAVSEDGGDGQAIVLGELQELVQEVLGVGRHEGIVARVRSCGTMAPVLAWGWRPWSSGPTAHCGSYPCS